MDRTITQEEYEVAAMAAKLVYEHWTGDYKDRGKTYVDAVLKAVHITVEPEPILPGITLGEWEYHGGFCHIEVSGRLIAKDVEPANGEVMAGSKKLVELVVATLRQNREGCAGTSKNGWVDYGPKLIDQLEKMSVNISEFRGEDDG